MARPAEGGEAESSLVLLSRAQGGDSAALEALCRRYLPRLRRWARGRLPRGARGVVDTDDLAQDALLAGVAKWPEFQPRHEGALQGYMRQVLLNRLRDEARRAARRPEETDPGTILDPGPSALEETIGGETLARYERALARLNPDHRSAVVLRIEMNLEFEAIAEALGRKGPEAARLVVYRALARLAEEMGRGDEA